MLWRPDTLRPLFDQCVPLAEALAKRSLAEEAAKISPQALALVESKGGWNPLAVAALKEGGAATAAKYLNEAGISAEYAPEIQLGIALASILGGHYMLLQELRAMAAERAAEKSGAIDIQATVTAQTPNPKSQIPNEDKFNTLETRIA